MKIHHFLYLIVIAAACSCSSARQLSIPVFSEEEMRSDFNIFRNMLEEAHPSLYWYTSKDSMDHYFDQTAASFTDSLPEPAFRARLSYVISKMGCGHTVAASSTAYRKSRDSMKTRTFPLVMKFWPPDTAVIYYNFHHDDSLLTKGTQVKAINGMPVGEIIDTLFRFISTDGYNLTHKYQALSNPGRFGYLYHNIIGFPDNYLIAYVDSMGNEAETSIKYFKPVPDSTKQDIKPADKFSKRERRRMQRMMARNMQINDSLQTAFMRLNSFTRELRLRGFFRRSFRQLNKEDVPNLVIDLRSNGGGNVTNSNLLTKYLSHTPFKIADSLYAIQRGSRYGRYRKGHTWNTLFMIFMTHKKRDGKYHFGLYEGRYIKPRKRNHYSGYVYLLTGGNTFSAASLVAGVLREQENVVLVGEETGGAAYGNTAWLMPEVVLPATGVRVRLPLFRLVIDKNEQKGYGVQPEIYSGPSVEAIRNNEDYKMKTVLELIRQQQGGR